MTCVGRLSSPLPRRYRRCASSTLLFTLPTFRFPRWYPTPLSVPLINLLGTLRPPRCLVLIHPHPPLHSAQTSFNPYQPVRRRAFFRARGEARKHNQRRIDGGRGGGQRIAILLLFVAPSCTAPRHAAPRSISDAFTVDRASLFGRPRLHR